ncbi:YMGG-like glycine zipper-containing protein [Olivibacter sp. XZL3]|uniref:YMGG-like glycine zipper-containing protein n=1 Tax=Olivibacter sp. XZL3 TaxID=1735116 RepID=UPI001064E79C|nr:YMGG-like glycine zipper-containing protein [Olivibacter sp. XZL3]
MNKIIALCLITGLGFTACRNHVAKDEALIKARAIKQLKDSLTLDSFRKAEIAEQERLKQENVQAQERQQAQAIGNPGYSEPQQQYEEAGKSGIATNTQKKGWSDAAKGTAIGAGAGAVMGTLIDKDKRLRGAAIGAAIGGAGGYAIGRKKDRQSGRVQ